MNLTARNTNALARQVYPLIHDVGVRVETRNGPALRFEDPVTIKLAHPWERVNFSAARDANPFFHLIEAMAMLCGHNSVPLMAHYAANMRNFSDDGKTFNAFYGTRMHHSNQLHEVIANLTANPDSRQELVVLWDIADLTRQTKDKACNFAMLFEVFQGKLRMTSFNRSNDAIWGGVTGANVVHFSFFQEYVACALGLPMGSWSHVSANLHIYLDNPKREAVLAEARQCDTAPGSETYPASHRVSRGHLRNFDFITFNRELTEFFEFHEHLLSVGSMGVGGFTGFQSEFLQGVVLPMAAVWDQYKYDPEDVDTIRRWLDRVGAPDWKIAAQLWLSRRIRL